jgi:hypothetical protein
MRTTIITAAKTLFRLSRFDLRRKHRKLFCHPAASAMDALSDALITAAFQQFGYLAALAALIFVNRHCFILPNSFNIESERIYIKTDQANNQAQ